MLHCKPSDTELSDRVSYLLQAVDDNFNSVKDPSSRIFKTYAELLHRSEVAAIRIMGYSTESLQNLKQYIVIQLERNLSFVHGDMSSISFAPVTLKTHSIYLY